MKYTYAYKNNAMPMDGVGYTSFQEVIVVVVVDSWTLALGSSVEERACLLHSYEPVARAVKRLSEATTVALGMRYTLHV